VWGTDLAQVLTASLASVAVVHDPSAGDPCGRVVAPTQVSDAWAAAVAELDRQVAQLPASDCEGMTLSVEAQEGRMRVVAVTRDGRRASRLVERPESLVAVALGLLMSIPQASTPAATPSPASRTPGPSEAPPPAAAPAPASAPASSPLALWAGLSGGLRLTAPTSLSVIDVEARGDILFGPWLMPVTLRSSLVSCLGQQGLDCDVYNDVSFGAGVGRRVRAGGSDIDFALEPSLVVMHMEYDGAGAAGVVAGTEVAMRFDLSARLAVPLNPHWFLTLTLDGGLVPSLLAKPVRLSLPQGAAADAQSPPPFPAWSGGVRVGASGALL